MEEATLGQLLRHVSLRQLQIFEAITRQGSFTRAAEALFLTQPTVSMQIKKLEEGLGLPLFEQIGKQVYLTDAGKVLQEHTRQILDSFANLEMEIADIQGMKTGVLRLAVVTTAKYFAPRALGKFCVDYPGVDVALKVTNRERLLERMAQNLDDLYIIGRPPESADMVFEPYLANPLVVLAPRAHPLCGQSRIDPAALAAYPMIMRERGSGTRMAVENFFSQRGIRLKIRMELGSNEAIKHAIDAGLGLSVLSHHTLALQGEDGCLAVLDVEGFPIPWQWCVGYVKGKRLSVIARTFLGFIKSESDNIMRG
jgi:LysR family transcriptional regulator, low CO2-responsive transcriptional regulator